MGSGVRPPIHVRTRHELDCASRGMDCRDCGCPKWLHFPQEGCEVRTGTTSWEIAEQQREAILASYDPVKRAAAELQARHDVRTVLQAEIARLRDALIRMEALTTHRRCC